VVKGHHAQSNDLRVLGSSPDECAKKRVLKSDKKRSVRARKYYTKRRSEDVMSHAICSAIRQAIQGASDRRWSIVDRAMQRYPSMIMALLRMTGSCGSWAVR
jgi:hypothetical protein